MEYLIITWGCWGDFPLNIERNTFLDFGELNELLAVQQWNLPIEKLKESIGRTWRWVTATDDSGKLIGFVRAISDGVSHAYIFHLLVHPEHRIAFRFFLYSSRSDKRIRR